MSAIEKYNRRCVSIKHEFVSTDNYIFQNLTQICTRTITSPAILVHAS